MNNQSNQGGRGSNLSEEDRRKGGEQAHDAKNATKEGRGSNLSEEDRRKGGEQSHRGTPTKK